MKRLLLVITLASLPVPPPVGAAPRACNCPTVTVTCDNVVKINGDVNFKINEDAAFTAAVANADAAAKLTFNWVVSAGRIRSGQGANSIVVDTTGLLGNSSLTATVEVSGLPVSCPRSASCTAGLISFIFHDKIDEYGNIKFEDEKARLDNFAIDVQNDPQSVGYIVGYGGRRAHRGEAARRIKRAKRYLVTVRGIPAERLVTIDGGYREELTVELRIRNKTLPPPQPFPTVDPTEVKFLKPPTGRRARR